MRGMLLASALQLWRHSHVDFATTGDKNRTEAEFGTEKLNRPKERDVKHVES